MRRLIIWARIEPWIPAGVYPDEGRNDELKNENRAKLTPGRQYVEEPFAFKARVVQ